MRGAKYRCRAGLCSSLNMHPLRRVGLIDNRFYRPKGGAEEAEAQPVLREQLARLGPFARILVRPDGYIAAIDRRSEDTTVAACLHRLGAAGWSA